MYRSQQNCNPEPRRGIILLVVLVMLTLFAVVGISFVFYADSEANASRVFRESETMTRADMDPEMLFSLFLNQLIYDTDDTSGIYSSLRGHSLARLMYGYNDDPNTVNILPFNGAGRIHEKQLGQMTDGNGNAVDNYLLVNYMCFKNSQGNFVDLAGLHDPERLGWRNSLNTAARGQFTGGFNVSYTYPDANNMFVAAVTADGKVLMPSYFRPYLAIDPNSGQSLGFGPLDPTTNQNWTNKNNPSFKYMTLRPRPAEHPNFPLPEDAGGDVKNLIGAPGGNDSIWIDIGAPVMTLPDGRKAKALFAPLIVPLDGRVNVNVHGNIRGNGNTHVSNQGWGPWEINLGKVLNNGTEWNQLFVGKYLVQPNSPPLVNGRYGPNRVINNAGSKGQTGVMTHFYSQVDFDSFSSSSATGSSNPIQLPQPNSASVFLVFPSGQAGGYDNGSSNNEQLGHPLLFNPFKANSNDPNILNNDDRTFGASNMAALLRYGDTGSEFLTSELMQLCRNNFVTANNAARIRRMITTHSFDSNVPAYTPWIYDLTQSQYTVPLNSSGPPQGPPLAFPNPLTQRVNGSKGEFSGDWRGFNNTWWPLANPNTLQLALGKIDLNRPLTPYPLMPAGGNPYGGSAQTQATYMGRFDDPNNMNYDQNNFASLVAQYQKAQTDRQNLANDIYRRLLAITGVAPVSPLNLGTPTDNDLAPRRWLAQLAVNIVDYIDDDDISTPFNFYTAADANGAQNYNVGALSLGTNGQDPELPRYWVFGTELPKVVLSEVLAEAQNLNPGNQVVKIWAELYNVMQAPPGGTPLQTQDGFPVLLNLPAVANSLSTSGNKNAYAPYRLVTAFGLKNRPLNDNVLGGTDTMRVSTQDADFTNPVNLLNGQPQPNPPSPNIPPYAAGPPVQGYFLLGPTQVNDPNYRDPFVSKTNGGLVPDTTPVLRSNNLQYNVAFAAGPDERTAGVTVLLRRLVNPHIPFDPNPSVNGAVNPWYNPYMTVDYLNNVPLQTTNPVSNPYASRGRRQPFGALTKLQNPGQAKPLANDSPVADQATPDPKTQVQHTFGLQNNPVPFNNRNEWLVHLDRQVISPMEILHVSGYQPYQLTQQFILGDDRQVANKFGHYVPWWDQDIKPVGNVMPASHRLYRLFEFLYNHSRVTGVDPNNTARIPGPININAIWDQEVFNALCSAWRTGDPNPNPNYYTEDKDVQTMWTQLLTLRSPGVAGGGAPGPNDKPFMGLATGFSSGNPADPQYPQGISIENTLLRSLNGQGGQRLFQTSGNPNIPETNHPYMQDQLLTKIFSNLTTRSNVFGVWVTVGFFEVTDDTTRPVTLGAEIGRAENKHIRHRMFAMVDRTSLVLASTNSSTAIAKAGPNQNITLGQITGTTSNGQTWTIQPGIPLEVDTGTNAEVVIVSAINGTQITANFRNAHSGTYSVVLRGNAGPQARFNPHAYTDLVPYFSIID
jgi:hypothetical protein